MVCLVGEERETGIVVCEMSKQCFVIELPGGHD